MCSAHGGHKKAVDPLELKSQVVVSHPTNLGPLEDHLNHWTMSIALTHPLKLVSEIILSRFLWGFVVVVVIIIMLGHACPVLSNVGLFRVLVSTILSWP